MIHRLYGPWLFASANLQAGQSGKISFFHRTDQALSDWIRVWHETSAERLSCLLTHHYKLPNPEVVITVTGGAQDFVLPETLKQAFGDGLAAAAAAARAWVITGGTDTGVMKLVGDALYSRDVSVPVLGIIPWGVVNERQVLDGAVRNVATYKRTPPSGQGAPLNPYHTHFVFVDNGAECGKAWGSEINLRTSVETHLARVKRVPIVLLVLNGGPGTMTTILQASLSGTPIVILADSGGAATAIYQYSKGGLDAVVEKRFHAMSEKLEQVARLNEMVKPPEVAPNRLKPPSRALRRVPLRPGTRVAAPCPPPARVPLLARSASTRPPASAPHCSTTRS